MHRCAFMLAVAVLPVVAKASWEPTWVTTWRLDGALWTHGSALERADDGSVYVTLDALRTGSTPVALSRLGMQGTLAWTREDGAAHVVDGGAAILPGDRVATIREHGGVGIVARVVDAQGLTLWEHAQPSGRLDLVDGSLGIRIAALSAHGDLLVRARDGTDLVVLRFASGHGDPSPPWRWVSGLSSVRAESIAAFPDGGAVVVGSGPSTASGFLAVRFAAGGAIRHADLEAGDIGNPLGAANVFATLDDATIVVASPETRLGSPGAMAWKIRADGTRAWTRRLSDQASLAGTFATGPAILAADGDVLVAVRLAGSAMRVLRLDGVTGATRWDSASSIIGDVTALVEAPDGRILATGFALVHGGGGRSTARLAEFESDGTPCRTMEVASLSAVVDAVAGPEGWTVLGNGGESPDYAPRLQRHDADGACTIDGIFGHGFDPA